MDGHCRTRGEGEGFHLGDRTILTKKAKRKERRGRNLCGPMNGERGGPYVTKKINPGVDLLMSTGSTIFSTWYKEGFRSETSLLKHSSLKSREENRCPRGGGEGSPFP